MSGDGTADGRAYEVTVAGRLGPVMCAAFADQGLRHVPPSTLLVVADAEVTEVVALLIESGIWVQELRRSPLSPATGETRCEQPEARWGQDDVGEDGGCRDSADTNDGHRGMGSR